MAERDFNTKQRAQRIDLNYFKKSFPIPHWRRLLTIGLAAAAGLWVIFSAVAGGGRIYNSGPIASGHAVFASNCAACHASDAVFGKAVTENACLACHDGPIHQAQQTFKPACDSCHVEHEGRMRLAKTSEAACTQCHASLKTKNGEVKIAAKVSSFNGGGHPEFTPLRASQTDPGTIKFNHAVHLKDTGIRGPAGNATLRCADCHRPPGIEEAWPWGKENPEAAKASFEPVTLKTLPRHVSARAYMEPVDYYEHCSSCHPLLFDKRFSDPVPHKDPKIVHDFVVAKYTAYIANHPDELTGAGEMQRIPTRPLHYPVTREQWISDRVQEAEFLLWQKTCKECHSLDFAAVAEAKIPTVAKAAITTRWLKHGLFDHQAHQMVECASCHAKAKTSKLSSDVLVPGIEVCQQCHRADRADAAESRCFECHVYHDWTKEKMVNGKYTVSEIAGR